MIWSYILLAVIAIIIIYSVSFYNRVVRLANNIDKAISNIDVILKQRQDELNNVIEAVKGYMKHERSVLKEVTDARTAMQSAKSLQEKANADGIAASAIKTIFAVAENYPGLKANQNFLALQKRISELENYIADRREFYNDSVTLFNNRVEQFPSNILSAIFGYKEKELFRAEEKKHSKLLK